MTNAQTRMRTPSVIGAGVSFGLRAWSVGFRQDVRNVRECPIGAVCGLSHLPQRSASPKVAGGRAGGARKHRTFCVRRRGRVARSRRTSRNVAGGSKSAERTHPVFECACPELVE